MLDVDSLMNRITASLDAGAAGASDSASAAMQLLHLNSRLAGWVHSETHTRLPSTLQHGPVLLLHSAAQSADSPHISAHLLDDTLVLLMYGVTYLEKRGDRTHLLRRFEDFRAQRDADRARLHAHALRIQAQFRCQRFQTQRLTPLELNTDASLIPEVQEMMQSGSPTSNDQLVTVAVDDEELQSQIEQYVGELRTRVEARRRDAELQRHQQQKAQREQEDLKKKQIYQKRRRHENACRRWNFFAGRLLRLHRDAYQQQIRSRMNARRRPILLQPSPNTENLRVDALREEQLDMPKCKSKHAIRRTASSLMKNAMHRRFIREFVAKAIARGVSRVLCESNMRVDTSQRGSIEYHRSSFLADRTALESGGGANEHLVLRIGLLLCDLHFGDKYMGLYQRFLERAAKEKGIVIEWELFDCVKSQFPTRALQRVLHAFLVAGGPNSGTNQAVTHSLGRQRGRRPDTSESIDSDDGGPSRTATSAAATGGGCWRKNLQKVLRAIYSNKRAALGGLGLGHIVLAEALGAKCSRREWEDGWSVLDPKLFDAKLLDDKFAECSSQQPSRAKYVGIKYLHGEFVQSMDFAPRGLTVWRSLDQRFVSSFKDKCVLSFDGFPECGTFVFETMSELYDREKQNLPVSPSGSGSSGYRRQQHGMVTRGSNAEEGAVKSPSTISIATVPARRVGVVDTRLTLEEKKQLLAVADISQVVAHALVDHFHVAALSSGSLVVSAAPTTIEIAAVANPVGCTDLHESIRAAAVAAVATMHGGGRDADGVKSVLLRVRGTSDGHLVVLSAQLEAFVLNHERKARESLSRRPSVSLRSPSSVLLRKNSYHVEEATSLLFSLHTLRDQKLLVVDGSTSSNSTTSATASGASIRQQRIIGLQLPAVTTSGTTAVDKVNAVPPSVSGATATGTRKRAPPIAKRVRTTAIGVLTLSEALSYFETELTAASARTAATGAANNNLERRQQAKAPSVILQFVDEESGSPPFHGPRRSLEELRALFLQLTAALRVGEIADDRVCILSRHTLALEFFRKRQPLWTLIKDCRCSVEMPLRQHVRRVSWYARYADTLLFDQDMLLNNSAKENETLFQQARYHGLRVFVVREDKAEAAYLENHAASASGGSRKSVAESRQRKSKRSQSPIPTHRHSSSSGGKHATDKEQATEEDMQIVEILLLALTGINGVLTPTPDVVLNAAQKLVSKSPIIAQVEQLFRNWQAKDSVKAAPILHKRTSLRLADDEQNEEGEDFLGGGGSGGEADIVAALDEREIALAMSRQFAEHGVRQPPSSSYVPLRPLQPKRGDQVFGAKHGDVVGIAALNLRAGERSNESDAVTPHRLRSIGTFRAAFQQRQIEQTPPQVAGTALGPMHPDDGDADYRVMSRAPELALSASMLQVPMAPAQRRGMFARW